MDFQGAANQPRGARSRPPFAGKLLGAADHLGVVRETQIIVRGKIDERALFSVDLTAVRATEHTLPPPPAQTGKAVAKAAVIEVEHRQEYRANWAKTASLSCQRRPMSTPGNRKNTNAGRLDRPALIFSMRFEAARRGA